MRAPIDLEPAERDPVAIRRTLFFIFLFIIGGIVVTLSYTKTLANQAKVFRPPVEGRLSNGKNVRWERHDGEKVALGGLEGRVWLFAQIVTSQPEDGQLGREAMLKMAEAFADESRVRCVLLTVDPDTDDPAKLTAFAAGMEAELPRWWLVRAEAEKMHKYVKNKMKFGVAPYQKDGKWIWDTSVLVVGQSMHMRGHFDFDKAAELEAEAAKNGQEAPYLEKLTERLEGSIRYILENPA